MRNKEGWIGTKWPCSGRSQPAPGQRQQLAVSMHLPVLLRLRWLRSKAQGGFQRCHQLPLAHFGAPRDVVLPARSVELAEGWVETRRQAVQA